MKWHCKECDKKHVPPWFCEVNSLPSHVMQLRHRNKPLRLVLSLVVMASGGMASATPHKVIDLRTHTDGDGGAREISFCARPSPDVPFSIPGHMFVAYSLEYRDRPRAFVALGHTTNAPPLNALLSYLQVFPSVPGSISTERYTAILERCLVVRVNKTEFERAYSFAAARADHFSSDPNNWPPITVSYRLGATDCMNFVIDVAKQFAPQGVTLPVRGASELPTAYVRRLIDAN